MDVAKSMPDDQVNTELAAHLVKVKLESEEKIFKLKDQIIRLHKEIEEANNMNRSLTRQLSTNPEGIPSRKLDFGIDDEPAEEKSAEDTNLIENSVAESWATGNEEFAQGNYSECVRYHTSAVKLLLNELKEQKIQTGNLETEVKTVRSEREFLRAKCDAITETISSLETELEQNNNTSVDLTEYEEKIESLRKNLEMVSKDKEELGSILDQKESFVKDISSQLRSTTEEVNSLFEKIDSLLVQKQRLELEKNELVLKAKESEKIVREQKTIKEETKLLVEDFKSEIQILKQEKTQLENKLEDSGRILEREKLTLKETIAAFEAEIKTLKEKAETDEEFSRQMSIERSNFEEELFKLQQENEQSSAQFAQKVGDLEAVIKDLEWEISNKEAEIAAIEENEEQTDISHQKSINELESKVASLEAINLEKDLEIADLRKSSSVAMSVSAELDSLRQDNSKLDQDFHALQKRNTDLLDKISYKDMEIVGKDRELTAASSKIDAITGETEVKQKHIIELENELMKLRHSKQNEDEFRMQLSERDVFISELEYEIRKLKDESNVLERTMSQAQSQNALEREKLTQAMAVITSSQCEVQSLTDIIAELNVAISEKEREDQQIISQNDSLTRSLLQREDIISENEVAISDQNTKITSLEANQLTLQSEILEKESKLSLTLDEKRKLSDEKELSMKKLRMTELELKKLLELTDVLERRLSMNETEQLNLHLNNVAKLQPLTTLLSEIIELVPKFSDQVTISEEVSEELKSKERIISQRMVQAEEEIRTLKVELTNKANENSKTNAELRDNKQALNLAMENLKTLTERVREVEAEKQKILHDATEFYGAEVDSTATTPKTAVLDEATLQKLETISEFIQVENDGAFDLQKVDQLLEKFTEVHNEKQQLVIASSQTTEEVCSKGDYENLFQKYTTLQAQTLEKQSDYESVEAVVEDLKASVTISEDILLKQNEKLEELKKLRVENQHLRIERNNLSGKIMALESSIVLRKELFQVTLADSDSEDFSDYIDDSCDEFSEDGGRELYASMLTETENEQSKVASVSELQKEVEEERKEGLKQYNLRARLEKKYERLASKYQKLSVSSPAAASDVASSPGRYSIASPWNKEASTGASQQKRTEEILRLKDSKILELKELLKKHEVDVDVLTRQLSRFFYSEKDRVGSGRNTPMSPTKRFFSVFKRKVAPNVLVVLVAFFTALSNNDFDKVSDDTAT